MRDQCEGQPKAIAFVCEAEGHDMRKSLYKYKRKFIAWCIVGVCLAYPLVVCWFVWRIILKIFGIV